MQALKPIILARKPQSTPKNKEEQSFKQVLYFPKNKEKALIKIIKKKKSEGKFLKEEKECMDNPIFRKRQIFN